MRQTFDEIILEAVKRGIPTEAGYDAATNSLYYILSGFSKSGTASVKRVIPQATPPYIGFIEGSADVTTRYDQTEAIYSFEDLVRIAFNWYITYKDRSPFENPSEYWVDSFVEFGMLEKKEVTVYEVKK